MKKELLAGERIFVIRDFFTPEECDAHIAKSEAVGYGDAPITTGRGMIMRKDIRNNDRVMVDSPPLAESLLERVRPYLPSRFGVWELCGLNERFRYYRYDVGQTFKTHYDGAFQRNNREASFLTFMVYLNDDFEGGGTTFYHDSRTPHLNVVPRRGTALVFEHHQLHEGAMVLRGRKYVLRSDVMYRVTGMEE